MSAFSQLASTMRPSTPAVLRPALISVTRRTLTRALLRDRSISFCRLRTFFRSPACDAAKIRRLSRRTFSSAWPQSTESQPGSSSGPFTCIGVQLAPRLWRPGVFSPQAHQTRVSALSSRAAALSGQLCGNRWRRSQHPVPGFLLPFGHRHSLLGSSCARWGIRLPSRSAYRQISRRTPSGLSRSACDRCGRGGRPLNPGDGGALPASQVRSGRHPPPSSGRPLFSRLLQPTGESANDEASSRIHSRSPVRPSPACGLPDGTGALGPFPGLRTLQLPASARRGGDGPCALDRELRHRHQPIPLRRVPLITCDFVSHDLVQPGRIRRRIGDLDAVPPSPRSRPGRLCAVVRCGLKLSQTIAIRTSGG